jgi:peptide/nickel transport system permease protein
MGKSIRGIEVRPLLWQRLKVTLRMVVLASVLAVVLAIGAGVLSAVKQYTPIDYTFTFLGFLFLSMPVFWLAALLRSTGRSGSTSCSGNRWCTRSGPRRPT